MYLRRLEIQGFKTVATKTVLEFKPDMNGPRGLTAIVGPNGSGKSNIADAMRWVMGEQSMKLLRAKKSEDVIFSGTAKKVRAGFAEVSLSIVNDDRPEIDMSEIVITRRLYRDGEAEYLVNNQQVRLSDISLLLANCGIGQKTYSVIGQGMVDAVLVASPSERKEFFDEASGLRPFQLKRNSSVNKLEASRDNLKQVENLLREIEPRLATLDRQVKRLRERDGIEHELRRVEQTYFGRLWSDLRAKLDVATTNLLKQEAEYSLKAKEYEALELEFSGLEKATPVSDETRAYRDALDGLREERARLRERQIRLESKKEMAKVVSAQRPWSPLPLSKIILEIEALQTAQQALFDLVESESPDWEKVRSLVAQLRSKNTELLAKLQQPAPEPTKVQMADPALEQEAIEVLTEMQAVTEKMLEMERKIQDAAKKEDEGRSAIFTMQHKLSAKRNEAQVVERRVTDARVEAARLETRRDGFYADLRQHAPQLEAELEEISQAPVDEDLVQPVEQLLSKMQRLRSQLEWIGGIDPETVAEYETTKKRFEELSTQTEDLQGAIRSLETVIEELDRTIKERGDAAFEHLNREFGLFFKKLFGGGEAQLVKVLPDIIGAEGEGGLESDVLSPEEGGEVRTVKAGIDIQATPPGKRLKAIALLSGGERALTSIALICAIMAINLSPFVVLDEVDAALDDANSRKFAEIIDTLSHRTQFVVVTHNRNTMNKANVLYGVTMGDDGVSQLLSVSLDSYSKA